MPSVCAVLTVAIGYYERAIRVRPDYGMANSNWGVALAMQGKLSEALRQNPVSASARYNLGLVLEKQGHLQPAAVEYRLALKIDPTFTKARDGLAGLQIVSG